ncbi:hypothetical protein Vadar_014501 [Vaccinium darrowii]|uniref:Uncharacterized protein n=1 Tax=Vaccinium darrowii TaxID=229202 RepID=A0ACB7YDU2_9ERIC|nr:hypothetical protein Vadar_014501 [Vaccinium darrowii]
MGSRSRQTAHRPAGARDSKFSRRLLGPPQESVRYDASDIGESLKRFFEVGLHEFCGGGKGDEEGHGRELVGALYPNRYSIDILWERKLDDGSIRVRERVGDKGPVCWGRENGDGSVAMEEESSEAEKWDGVAFGHEGKENYVRLGRTWRSSHLSL